MPDSLKAILVDDWEKVTRENRLVPLPSKTPVAQFLADYSASEGAKRREGSAEADILEEVIAGVKEYFNKSIGRILLYRFERPQWSDIHAQLNKGTGDLTGKLPTDIYGVEHLCRLFGMCCLATCQHLTNNSSIHARPDRPHQHGLSSCEPSSRGAAQNDSVAQQERRQLPVSGIRAAHSRLH